MNNGVSSIPEDLPVTLFIVSDEQNLLDQLSARFKIEGWKTVSIPPETDATSQISAGPLDFIILDLDNSKISGWTLLHHLKISFGDDTPIIAISGKYKEDTYICQALSFGAEDYLKKPLAKEVLVAKLKNHLKRRGGSKTGETVILKSSIGKLTLHLPSRTTLCHHVNCNLFYQHSKCGSKLCKEIRLTKKEFNILAYFILMKKRHILTRKQILDSIWENSKAAIFEESVDKHIESLRKKLGNMKAIIKTVHGVGYQIAEDKIL